MGAISSAVSHHELNAVSRLAERCVLMAVL